MRHINSYFMHSRLLRSLYDPDKDVILGAPMVTASDYSLLNMCDCLVKEVQRLNMRLDHAFDRIEYLCNQLNSLEERMK